MENFELIKINKIKVGDLIIHNGKVKEVGIKDLQMNGYFLIYLFNDSYNLNRKLVKKLL